MDGKSTFLIGVPGCFLGVKNWSRLHTTRQTSPKMTVKGTRFHEEPAFLEMYLRSKRSAFTPRMLAL